jgi:MFS family permease
MILLILGMTFLGGLIFNSILDSLPKIFALRLMGLPTSGLGISGLVSGVYVVGAMGQIVVGMLLDRYSLRRIYIAVVLLQVPFLLIASRSSEWALVGVSCVMMFTIFGVIPIQDTLVARSTSDEWRARAYALKYVVALGVGFLAVPLVSYVYQSTGEFVWLFGLFAGISLSMAALAFLLPTGIAPPPRALASSLASSPAAGGAAGGAGGD